MKSSQDVSAGEKVYQFLKKEILSGKIRPGQKIPEQSVADMLNISRTPIKEALIQLAADGLVQIYPKRYSEVKVFEEEEIRQIGELRIALEIMSAKLLTFKASCADFDRLENFAIQCDNAAKTGDLFEKTSTDMQFHLAFVECTKNPLLYSFQKQLCYRVQLIQMNSNFSKEEDKELIKYHSQIIKYMRERDLNATYKIIEDHFYKFYKLDKQYPPKFFQLFDTIDFW